MTEPPLPPQARALGRVVSVHPEHHPLNSPAGGARLLYGLVLGAACVGLMTLAVPVIPESPARMTIALLKLLVLLWGAAILVVAGGQYLRSRRPRACLFLLTEGVAWAAGDAARAYRWDQITRCGPADQAVRLGPLRVGTIREFTVTFQDGWSLILDQRFLGSARVAAAVQSAADARLFAACLARLEGGEALEFGALRLSAEWLELRGQLAGQRWPYRDLRPVAARDGGFYVYEAGKVLASAQVRRGTVPHLVVCVRLINALISRHAGERRPR